MPKKRELEEQRLRLQQEQARQIQAMKGQIPAVYDAAYNAAMRQQAEANTARRLYNTYRREYEDRMRSGGKVRRGGGEEAYNRWRTDTYAKARAGTASAGEIAALRAVMGREARDEAKGYDYAAAQKRLEELARGRDSYEKATRGRKKDEERNAVLSRMDQEISQLSGEMGKARAAYEDANREAEYGKRQDHPQNFWETLLNVSARNTGGPQSALPGMTDVGDAGGVVRAGAAQFASGFTNAAGTLLEGLGKVNDAAFDAQHRQQRTAAENSLAYWTEMLEKAETEDQRKRAKEQIAQNERILAGLERLKNGNTADIDSAAQSVYGTADRMSEYGGVETEKAKDLLRRTSAGKVGDLLVDAGVSGVQMLGDAAINALLPGTGLASMGTRVFGQGAQEARQAGASFGQQLAYGAGSAAVEVATEKMFGVFDKVYGKGWLDNTKLAKGLAGAVEKMQLSPAGRTALSLLTNLGEEATEELVSGVLNPALKTIYNGEHVHLNPIRYFAEDVDWSDTLHDALVGGVLGLFGGTNHIVENAGKTKAMGEQYGADSEALVREALELDPDNKTAQAARKQLERGEKLKDATIRRIVEENEKTAKAEREAVDEAAKEIAEEFGEEAANAFREGKPDGVELDSYRDAFREAYEYGRDTAARDDAAGLDAAQEALKDSGVPAESLENAYEAGRSQERKIMPPRSRAHIDMDYVESRFGKAGAEVYQMARTGNVDPVVFDRAFNTAYQYGTAGATEEQAIRAVRGNIPVSAVQAAYTVAREQAAFRMREQRIKLDAAKVSTRRGPGTVTFDGVNTAGLTGTQRAQIQVIRGISKVSGINVRFVENADFKGANGSYDPNTNTITIDVNAGRYSADDINDVVMGKTMSHELTHFIQHNNPEAYEELKKFVSQHLIEKGMSLDLLADEKITNSKGELTPDQAIDEVVADACENMLRDTTAIDTLAKENWGLFKRIRNWLRNFHNALKRAFAGEGYTHPEAKAMLDKAAELQKIWDDAFVRAVENYQQTADGRVAVEMAGKNGETVAVNDGNGHVQASMRTYREGGREQLKTYLEQRVKDKAITREEADDMISQMDDMYKLCQSFADQYALFGQWSEAEVRVDPKTGNPIFSVVKANGEYAMNLDFSLVCKKRRTLDAVFEQMINDGIMEDFEMKETSIAAINDIIRDHGFETACALCFVDSKRYRQGIVADAFVGMYNELVRSMIKDGQHADAFNFGGNSLIVNDGKGIDTLQDSDLDFTRINEVLKTEGKKTVLYKIAKDLKENPADRKLLMRGDFMSAKAFDTVKETNQRIMGLYNAKKGAGGPKASSLDVQYLGEIIGQKKFNAEKAYSVGGVRIQSFSDYMPRLVFDYMQMIADLSAKQLPAHAYTKEPLFVLQFGLSGIKSNMSLVPEVVEGGVAPGLDKDGNYAWRDGQSFGSTVYGGSKAFIQKCYEIIGKKYNGQDRLTAAEGYELAKAIQNAPGYGVNCGTIAVGVSDEHIRKMLRDPDIRMVIPYHKSSLNHIVAVMTNIDRYHDYTGVQNTRRADGTKLTKRQKDFNYNEALQRLGDAKAAADEYKAWCDKKGYLPKFDQFREEEGYYKLLEDFSTYDMNGESAPQGGVTLTLPGEDSAFGSMAELMRMGLEEDALLQGKQDKAVPEIVAEIKKTLPGIEAKQRVQKSERITAERDAEYLELVGKYENETGYQKSYTEDYLDRLVAAAAKEHGYTTPKIYHGTRSFGFTVFDTSGTKPYAQKGYIYASTKRQVAANYAGDNHYAGVRPIGTKYDGGSSAESIIKDAKSVYGTTYRKPTKEDIDNRIRKDYAEAQKVREKLNELWSPLDNIPQEVANAVDWMTDIINTTVDNDLAWQVGADGIINGTNEEKVDLQKQLQHDFGRLEADRALVRDYYGEHRSEMNDDQKKYFRYLMSYEFGDALIDIQYGLCQVLTPDNLLINGDSFADMANLREAMDEVHNIGAYQLYGDLGDKPFIFDANGAQFWALKVPEVSDGYTDTDTVCKWAKAHGYTSVVMKNIYDYGDKADNYVFFNSEQVKSADPVTYDDKGNVIPLSKRFDTGKSDIRYSNRDVGSFTTKESIDAEELEREINSAGLRLTSKENNKNNVRINNWIRENHPELAGLVHFVNDKETGHVTVSEIRTAESVEAERQTRNEEYRQRAARESFRKRYETPSGYQALYDAIENHLERGGYTGRDVTIHRTHSSVGSLSFYVEDAANGVTIKISDHNSIRQEMEHPDTRFVNLQECGGIGEVWQKVESILQEENRSQYSLRSPTDISSRELLANATESVARGPVQKELLQRYQAKVGDMAEIRQKLNEQRKLLRENEDGSHPLSAEERLKAQNRAKLYAGQLNRAEKELRQMEATEPMKKMMDREQENYRKIIAEDAALAGQMHQGAKDAELLRRYNNRMQQRIEAARRSMTEYRRKRWDTEDRRKLRGKISDGVKRLDKMLRNPTDQKHIPDGLQGAVLEMLEVFTNDTSVFDRNKLARVTAEYQKLKTADTNLGGQFDEDIPEMLNVLTETIGGRRLSELSADELRMVRDVVEHFAFIVKNENAIFVNGRRESLAEAAESVIAQSEERGHKVSAELGRANGLARLLTDGNIKPEYFFRDIGGALQKLWKDVLRGQSRYAFNLQAAKEAKEKIQKETGYREWWNDKTTYTAATETGQEITLNIGQALSLLATYQRELAAGNTRHVTLGGFLYAEDLKKRAKLKDIKNGQIPGMQYKTENREAHPMSVNDMDALTDWLRKVDPRTLDYVARMVQYLSEDMSALGNETSMELYGYRKFGEEYYYPIKSADEFLKQEPGQAGYDNTRWKHKGFTKSVIRGANNPFVLMDFDEVWGQHVSQMCMYNGMAAAQDNIVRLLNYKHSVSDLEPSTSVKAAFKSGYGERAFQYIDTLLSDLNGGVMIDPREGAMNSMISLFKKNAVFASMSVAIQQPSSIARAMAVMDPKYLVMTAASKRNYKELMKYSGVAIIKNIGGFDTNTGRSGADWLMTGRKSNLLEKYETAATWLPQKMDEVTWGHIWNAVKAEIADTTDLKGEEYYRRCGERFDEVIELTQVYDSVLTRSENMRSKSGLVKAATAFMAEPTTTLNMVVDALHNAKKDPKQLARTMGAVLASILLNNLLKAIVTAPRDKDEDRTWIEKYVKKLTEGIKNDINPMGYIPLLSDVQDMLDGYTVEASYASTVSDLIEAVQKAYKDPTVDSGVDAIAAISGVFGVPTKNLVRDVRGVLNTFVNTRPLDETTKRGLTKAFEEGLGLKTALKDDIENLYKADRSGDAAQRQKMLSEIGLEYEDKVKHFLNAGYDKDEAAKKARTSVKKAVTSYLKPLYQAATTTAEKNKLKSLALRIYVGGKQVFNGYNFDKDWGN